jgi:predicted Rossmann-fold nucleotide-binding protein
MQPIPIILFGHDYWSKVIDFDFLADSGVISHEHLDLFEYADTPESAWEKILRFNKALKKNSTEEMAPDGVPDK